MHTLLWYAGIVWDYVVQMLPCMALAAAGYMLVLPRRRRLLSARGLRSGPWRESALFLFVLFAAGLAALTLFQAGFWSPGHWYWVLRGAAPVFYPVDLAHQLRGLQMRPFHEISLSFDGAWRFFMLLGNGAMFLPVGFFPALLWRRAAWYRSGLTGLCASACVECVQFFIGRSTDIDDVILNTLGALCGFWLFALLRRLSPAFVEKFRCVKVEDFRGGTAGNPTAPPGAGSGEL